MSIPPTCRVFGTDAGGGLTPQSSGRLPGPLRARHPPRIGTVQLAMQTLAHSVEPGGPIQSPDDLQELTRRAVLQEYRENSDLGTLPERPNSEQRAAISKHPSGMGDRSCALTQR
ncbi:MAG: hypothetical protein KDB03_15785 [Planctomycetales bacterium]|nr:hypothetical protein [Planctomycetales bacterium]